MFDITSDIQPLSYFKRHTPQVVRQLKKSGRPMVLTIDGKAQIVVMDAKAYRAYERQMEEAEMIAFLKESEEDIKAGRGRPARKVLEEIGKKYGLPSHPHSKSKR